MTEFWKANLMQIKWSESYQKTSQIMPNKMP